MPVFKKSSTSPFEQIILLKNKGLIIADEAQALADLNAISFFRLTPYMEWKAIPSIIGKQVLYLSSI